MSPDEKESSLKQIHLRSGSFGGFEAASVHSSSVQLPNEKDYGFIEDEITRFSTDLTEKEPLSTLIQVMVGKEKGQNQEQMEQILDDIKFQKDNFKKMIDYSLFLLENARKTKEQLNTQININSLIEENQDKMQEEVGCMREDWKRE